MKYEYSEGREATKNFEDGMKAIFKVSKESVVKVEKVKRNPSRQRKRKRSDRD
jgi:hypothetical protein